MSVPSIHSKIFFSCTTDQYVSTENLVPVHVLSHLFEGEMKVNDVDNEYTITDGHTTFCSRNSLLRFTKKASKERPLKSVAIIFSQELLQQYFIKNKPVLTSHHFENNFLLSPNVLWTNYFNSLKPYIDMQEELPAELSEIKQLEALSILRTLHKGVDQLLINFDKPGKIDLAEFMQKNFIFNLSLQRFAYLTGRSLSSFKRDFQKLFNNTPQRWLTNKKLNLAHYLIEEKKIKPSEAYIESGFENFSHFSFAFKNHYGYNPSQLI